GGGRRLGPQPLKQSPKKLPAEPARQRHQFRWQQDRASLDHVDDMRGAIGAKAEQHRMSERQQPRLPHQHVVGQREDRHHADLAQQYQRKTGVTALRPVIEQERQGKQDDEGEQPGPMAAQHVHVSRVPIRPRGRNTRISTIIRNGSNAPILGSVTVSSSWNGVLDVTTTPNFARRSANETSNTTAKVWIRPIRIEAMKHPVSEPRPPNTTTTKTIGPIV